MTNEPNTCQAIATYSAINATDNCALSVTISPEGSPNSGSSFPVGRTSLTYRATDNATNSRTCTFVVDIADIEQPQICK